MRLPIILVMMLMLLASGALAFGGTGSVVVDIVGSKTDNTRITTSGEGPIELEIVGSTSNNTTIAPPEKRKIVRTFCRDSDECNCSKDKRPWDGMHLGVDAWYGTFWYRDINLPQWPQI